MTTHYQKILALGTKMAENLTTMGVPSQFSEGGLTLADKILEIRSMSDGIFLFGRDDIIQTGGTARFSGVCLDDSKLVRDTVELFSCDEGSFSNPLTSNTTGFTLIDDSEEITTSSTGTVVSVTYPNALRYTPVLYLSTQSITVRFKCKTYDELGVAFSGGLMTSSGNMDTYTTLDLGDDYLAFMDETFNLPTGADLDNWTDVKIEYTPSQQKLYINGTLVATATEDLTDNSWYHNYFGITQAQIKDFALSLNETVHATGSGALTYDYTGVGIGERNFCLRSGGVQSETCGVIDALLVESFDNNSLIPNTEIRKATNVSYTIENNQLVTSLNSWEYIRYRLGGSNFPFLNSIGHIRAKITTDKPLRLQCIYFYGDNVEQSQSNLDITGSGTYTLPVTFTDTLTVIYFNVTNRNSSSTPANITIDDILFYP